MIGSGLQICKMGEEDVAEIEVFKTLVSSLNPSTRAQTSHQKFVKNLEEIPQLELSSQEPRRKALLLYERVLIRKFSGLWECGLSPQLSKHGLQNTGSKIQSQVSFFAPGCGYFVFLFPNKEAEDLIFRFGPYFMGSKGLYLAPWSLDFNPGQEIASVPVWVKLPHLPLIFWDDDNLRDIGNK